jgi:hypothetical protein
VVLAGTISPSLSGGSCLLTQATFLLTSGMISTGPAGGPLVTVTFQNTTMKIDNITFNAGCVPTIYRLTFTGPVILLTQGVAPINASFNALTMDVDDSGDPTQFRLGGGISSPCFGGPASITTVTTLTVLDGHSCPNAGELMVSSGNGSAEIFYRSDESVDVDTNGDHTIDVTAPNCLDPRLLMCVA